MIKVAVPHKPYLFQRVNRVPSLFIHTIRHHLDTSSDMELVEIGDTEEEIIKSLQAGEIPDVMVAIGASGMTTKTNRLLKKYGVKTILFWDDLHWFNSDGEKSRHRIFRDADVLLLPYHKTFMKMGAFKDYHHKSKLFPWFAPMECFEAKTLWENRQPLIVVSGCTIGSIYPTRKKMLNYAGHHPEQFNILPHPGYSHEGKKLRHEIVGKAYYQYLSNFRGAFVSSGIPPVPYIEDPYPICKFFEIPGCGCTPFFEPISDLDDLGFVPDVHYIPVESEPFSFTRDIGSVAEWAQKFVFENHSADVRCQQLFDIIRCTAE